MISSSEFFAMQERVLRNGGRKIDAAPVPSNAAKREMDLHERIIEYCNSQWPRWKFIRARSDQKSTIAEGAQDFTIFMPNGRALCVECKSADGKLSDAQRAWHKEMEMLNHAVHIVRSMEDFLRMVVMIEAFQAKPPHAAEATQGGKR